MHQPKIQLSKTQKNSSTQSKVARKNIKNPPKERIKQNRENHLFLCVWARQTCIEWEREVHKE